MKLYDVNEFSGGKQCKTALILSEDKQLKLYISYEYIPEKPKLWVYCCFQFTKKVYGVPAFIEDGSNESYKDFKTKIIQWYKLYGRLQGLSWYTTKKLIMIAFKLITKVFK